MLLVLLASYYDMKLGISNVRYNCKISLNMSLILNIHSFYPKNPCSEWNSGTKQNLLIHADVSILPSDNLATFNLILFDKLNEAYNPKTLTSNKHFVKHVLCTKSNYISQNQGNMKLHCKTIQNKRHQDNPNPRPQ